MINPNDCDFKSRKSKESHFIEHKKLDEANHEKENIETDIFRCSQENNYSSYNSFWIFTPEFETLYLN